MSRRSLLLATAFLGVLGAFVLTRAQNASPQPASSAQARSTSDGVYTETQATRGEALYHQYCSSCHGDKLTGKVEEESPALSGRHFSSTWDGRTVGYLFKQIVRNMPQDDPGKLSPQQGADLVAYILSFNKFPAGEKELNPTDPQMPGILIEAKRKESPDSAAPPH